VNTIPIKPHAITTERTPFESKKIEYMLVIRGFIRIFAENSVITRSRLLTFGDAVFLPFRHLSG